MAQIARLRAGGAGTRAICTSRYYASAFGINGRNQCPYLVFAPIQHLESLAGHRDALDNFFYRLPDPFHPQIYPAKDIL